MRLAIEYSYGISRLSLLFVISVRSFFKRLADRPGA